MPLYEYQCKQCGHRFEKIQSFSAPEIKECPVCKGEVEKLLSAPSFQFKGSGWYVSDYGKGGAAGSNTRPDTQAKSESSSGDGGSSEGKSSGGDTKPAAASSSDSGSSAAAPAASASSAKKD